MGKDCTPAGESGIACGTIGSALICTHAKDSETARLALVHIVSHCRQPVWCATVHAIPSGHDFDKRNRRDTQAR